MLGFETIGNATIIAYDGAPVLATDAWITDSAYFGSWGHSHVIPTEQLEAIKRCKYFWFSHGHPDHLNGDSLPLFAGKKILLPDHVGGRIHADLVKQGHDVYVMKDRVWLNLSENVKAMCIADYNQDAIILIDVGGRLLVNVNDAGDRGWGPYVKKVIAAYDKTFLLALSGYGDADMINFFDESGKRLQPPAALKLPVGEAIAKKLERYGCKYFVPSSSMHRYQREDSFWANDYTTPLEALGTGFESDRAELLPAFIRYNCETDTYERLNPASNALVSRPPSDFGDNWSDALDPADLESLKKYLSSIDHLFS
ncbi:MAG: MBL fold metallo-hydrolase, partial [Deltaproteobacteria bacterium]|nr:MBL fold metallo-hydrolase [Deltaproteobacteria bacterium]